MDMGYCLDQSSLSCIFQKVVMGFHSFSLLLWGLQWTFEQTEDRNRMASLQNNSFPAAFSLISGHTRLTGQKATSSLNKTYMYLYLIKCSPKTQQSFQTVKWWRSRDQPRTHNLIFRMVVASIWHHNWFKFGINLWNEYRWFSPPD